MSATTGDRSELDVDVVVVGGGISGLAAAQRLESKGDASWVLVERDPALGGKIMTEEVDGFVIEGGPDCFLAAKPGGMALCRELGVEDRLTGTDPRFRKTYVKRDGRLHELPAGLTGLVPSQLRPLMTTTILRPSGRARAALEMAVPAKRGDEEESIAQFVTRRFGRETYEWLVEPLLSGIFAGDGEKLSLAATFPRLIDSEREKGSIVRQMLLGKLRSALGRKPAAGAMLPMGFVTPQQGLGFLVGEIARRLPADRIRTGLGVERLEPAEGGWQVELSDGSELRAGSVIVSTPAFVTADLTEGFAPELAEELRGIPYVSSATVSVGFDAADIERRLDGYGYVSPRAEGGPIVACTWTSNKFPARVPAEGILIRFFLGRAGAEEIALADEETIRGAVREELRDVLGIEAEPRIWRLYRWPRGLPQYHVGHLDRLARIERQRERFPGLLLAGSPYRGVGIPDCIESGWQAALAASERSRDSVSGTVSVEAGV